VGDSRFAGTPGAVLERLLRVIEETFPVPGRFRSALPGDVAELSRLLTSARPDREGGYLGRPNLLSAYLRYFLPWNVFRLSRLFALVCGEGGSARGAGTAKGAGSGSGSGSANGAGVFLNLRGGDAVTDLGSGPLTLPVALWLFRPELRKLNLEFRCVDHTGSVLEAGKKLFGALERAEGETGSWKIRTIRASLDLPVRGGKAALVTAINVFNEVYQRDSPARASEKALGILDRSGEGSILVMEPGVPKSGAFIAALRNGLLERGKRIAAPCTHETPCPLPGGGRGAKWCHFAFDASEAPAKLHRLSAAAGIPKERAVFSFLLAGKEAPESRAGIRVVSDAFPVPGGWGRYGCGYREGGHEENGLVLLWGSKAEMEGAPPGTLVEIPAGARTDIDGKSGGISVNVHGAR
jgi:hypothetical protein